MKKIFFIISFLLVTPLVLGQKESLRLGMVLEPPHLDPTIGAAGATDEIVYNNVFQGLTRIDRNGDIQPNLAQYWKISEDKLTYTFTLHKNIYFHDGQKLTSKDVVFSLQRAQGNKSQNAQKQFFKSIKSVTQVSDSKIRIQLTKPNSSFLFYLAWGDSSIVKHNNYLNNKIHPIGTGPFRFQRWVRGNYVQLEKNTSYWSTPAQISNVSFHFINDNSAAINSILTGDIDAYANFPSPESMPIFEEDPRFSVVIGKTEGETILAINNKRTPFDNILVRKALNFAINKEFLIKGVLSGYGTPIGSHFSPNHKYFIDLSQSYPYQPETAKKLIKEAGFPNGFQSSIVVPPTSYAQRSAEVIASQLADVGIHIDIIPIQWAHWLQKVFQEANYELTIIAHTEPLDIAIYSRADYYFNYYNPRFNTLITQLENTFLTNQQKTLYHELQNILVTDAVNVFLFQLPKLGVWNKNIEGLWHNSPLQANDLTKVFWKK